MGDTGSLALGGALASIAILTHHELSLAIIGGVFVIETLSSFIQIVAIRRFNKRVFLKDSKLILQDEITEKFYEIYMDTGFIMVREIEEGDM